MRHMHASAPYVEDDIVYPSSDGKPMAEGGAQYEWLVTIQGNLYYYDPERETLSGWVREGERFVDVDSMDGFVSPRLRIRFELKETLRIFGPDGAAFETFAEQIDARRQAEARADAAEEHAGAAEARAAAAEARAAALEARLAALDAEP